MNKPIRILHVLQRMEAGGTQALLMNLYRNIDRNKVQFDFLVEYPDKQFYDDEIISMGGRIFYTSVRKDFNVIKFKRQLKKVIQKNNYKIVHVHAFTIGFFALNVAKKCNVPVRIAHSHNNQTVKDKFYLLKLFMQKKYTKYATDLFACSTEAGKYLFKDKKFQVLNNSIDSSKFIFDEAKRNKTREELKLTNNFVVGHVGRLHPQKNHDFLFNVFNEIKKNKNNAKLILIGKGPLENELKEKIKKLKIENDVIFLGNRTDMDAIFMSMDVFVLPSLFEGLGIVAIESQAAGTPVIVSNGVSEAAIISPICKKLNLSDSYEKWAVESIELSNNENCHSNMQKYIIDSNYDIKNNAIKMEQYYLENFKGD